MKNISKSPSGRTRSGTGPTIASGERLACLIRIVFGSVFLALVISYSHTTPYHWSPMLLVSAGACTGTMMVSAALLLILKKGLFKDWMAVASTASDLLFAGAAVWSAAASYPLHFATSTAPAILCVVIALSAVRLMPNLVLATGFASALIHLSSAVYFFTTHIESLARYVSDGGAPLLGINIFDEVSKAVIMVTVAWIISYVTSSLRSSRSRYMTIFENAPDGILVINHDGSIRTVNERLSRMLMMDRDQLVGRRAESLLSSADSDQQISIDGGLIGRPATMTRSDGVHIPIKTVTSPITIEGERCSVTSVRDISEQLLIEKQLSRSQEMEAIGNMAGGLAHDIKNILGGILGAASLTKRMARRIEPAQGERLGQQMDTIVDCGQRARDVIDRLLTFSRGATLRLAPINLNHVVVDTALICRNTFGPEYRVRENLMDAPPLVQGDQQALVQAVLNLCINSRDAMPEGGELVLTVGAQDPGDPVQSDIPGALPHFQYMFIEVRDDGPGISEDIKDLIFDPFYSTKAPHEGSGLGLPMVMSITLRHNGFVDFSTSHATGAVFRLYIPILDDVVSSDYLDNPRGTRR